MALRGVRVMTLKRQQVTEMRARILAEAKRAGFITSARARKITGLNQIWYHLNALCKEGLLQHIGYSRWKARPPNLINELCDLSNAILAKANRQSGKTAQDALYSVRQEIDNLIHAFNPSGSK
jgi:hypothetical protein